MSFKSEFMNFALALSRAPELVLRYSSPVWVFTSVKLKIPFLEFVFISCFGFRLFKIDFTSFTFLSLLTLASYGLK